MRKTNLLYRLSSFFGRLPFPVSKQTPANKEDLLRSVQSLMDEKKFQKALNMILDNQTLIKLDTEAMRKLLGHKKACVISLCLQYRETAQKLLFSKKDYDEASKMYKELTGLMKANLELFQISEEEYKNFHLEFYLQLGELVTNRDNPKEPLIGKLGPTIGPIREKLLKQCEEKYGESDKYIIFSALVECTISEFSIPIFKRKS